MPVSSGGGLECHHVSHFHLKLRGHVTLYATPADSEKKNSRDVCDVLLYWFDSKVPNQSDETFPAIFERFVDVAVFY